MLSEISQSHKYKYCMIPLICEILRAVKIRDTQSWMVVAKGWEQREIGNYWLIGIEFQFNKMKRVMELDGGDSCKTL